MEGESSSDEDRPHAKRVERQRGVSYKEKVAQTRPNVRKKFKEDQRKETRKRISSSKVQLPTSSDEDQANLFDDDIDDMTYEEAMQELIDMEQADTNSD